MSQTRLEELMELIISDKAAKAKLKKLGLSEKEIENLMKTVATQGNITSYNRILAEDEKRVITPDAFGYLMKLLNCNSINEDIFEKIITLSLQLHVFLKKQINKKMMDDIINFMIFSGQQEVTVKELLDLFFIQDSDFEFDESIN